MYDPVIDSFQVYESAPIQESPIKLKLPLEDVELPWASSIVNGNPVPKDNISELRTPTDPSYQDILDRMAETHSEETTENLNNKTTSTKKTITKKDQKNNALIIMNNLVKRGYKPHIAAGITGNLFAESGLNPGNSANDLGVIGGGLAAWRGDLFQNLKRNAKSNNIPWTDINFQLDYLNNLLNQNNPQMNDVRDRLSKSKNPYEASEAWAYYERYAGYDGSTKTARKAGWSQSRINQEHNKRGNLANEIYELWKTQTS